VHQSENSGQYASIFQTIESLITFSQLLMHALPPYLVEEQYEIEEPIWKMIIKTCIVSFLLSKINLVIDGIIWMCGFRLLLFDIRSMG
jgi:hypothetical protein